MTPPAAESLCHRLNNRPLGPPSLPDDWSLVMEAAEMIKAQAREINQLLNTLRRVTARYDSACAQCIFEHDFGCGFIVDGFQCARHSGTERRT
jgi:hypothetical protein